MGVDLETVITMGTYRVGFLPPELHSLAPGELYVEAMPPGGGVPRLWVGTPGPLGFSGNVALIVPAVSTEPTEILIETIDNPSPASAVRIVASVSPGAEVELAALRGTNLDQVNSWSPWDATGGSFAVTWYLPPGDDYRVRVRLRDNPQIFTDSNLFAVVPD